MSDGRIVTGHQSICVSGGLGVAWVPVRPLHDSSQVPTVVFVVDMKNTGRELSGRGGEYLLAGVFRLPWAAGSAVPGVGGVGSWV